MLSDLERAFVAAKRTETPTSVERGRLRALLRIADAEDAAVIVRLLSPAAPDTDTVSSGGYRRGASLAHEWDRHGFISRAFWQGYHARNTEEQSDA